MVTNRIVNPNRNMTTVAPAAIIRRLDSRGKSGSTASEMT